jgi:ferredoxin
VPECPTEAIFSEDDLPEKWAEYKELNARLAENWPNIDKKKEAMEGAEEWKGVEQKRKELSERPFEG